MTWHSKKTRYINKTASLYKKRLVHKDKMFFYVFSCSISRAFEKKFHWRIISDEMFKRKKQSLRANVRKERPNFAPNDRNLHAQIWKNITKRSIFIIMKSTSRNSHHKSMINKSVEARLPQHFRESRNQPQHANVKLSYDETPQLCAMPDIRDKVTVLSALPSFCAPFKSELSQVIILWSCDPTLYFVGKASKTFLSNLKFQCQINLNNNENIVLIQLT